MPKKAAKSWGQADKDRLADLINGHQIDITNITLPNIKQVRLAHFRHHDTKNFFWNFRDYLAAWDLEVDYSGARCNRGKLQHMILFIYLCASSLTQCIAAAATPVFQTKRKAVPTPLLFSTHVWHQLVPHNTTHITDSPLPPTSHSHPPPISATTTTTTTGAMAMPREAIVQTGLSSGNDMADLAIGILRTDQGLYMSRLPLGFVLAFDRGQ
jgi:hypothetical protein